MSLSTDSKTWSCQSRIECDGVQISKDKRRCSKCQKVIDRIAKEFNAETRTKRAKMHGGGVPICSEAGCSEPRVAPDPFCEDHKDSVIDLV